MDIGILLLIGIAVVVVVMFYRYNSKDKNGFETFLIKKGEHYSIRANRPFPSKYKLNFHSGDLQFIAMFSTGCDYCEKNFNGDVNKLYGISYGFDNHYRSVRIGWRYSANYKKIELFVYAYANGRRTIIKLFNVDLYEEVSVNIQRVSPTRIKVEASTEDVNHHCFLDGIAKSGISFILWPYFGGNKPAPHDMKLFIR